MDTLYTIARIKGGVIAWTDEQVAYIIQKYTQENYTLKQLGKEFKVPYSTIRRLLNQQGIQSRGNKQGYPRDSFYFNQINTPDKAYWLGILYADGSINSTNNEIALGLIDEEHIKKFQQALGAVNHKIHVKEDRRFKNAKTGYILSVKDAQLHKDLIKWGCIPNKTDFPNIPYHYISHFIRGYFDGDGSIHYLKGSNNFRISFLGTFEFLTNIKNELHCEKISLAKGTGKAYVLQINGRKQLLRILEYVYKDSTPDTRLDRKYKKYLDFLKWAHHP